MGKLWCAILVLLVSALGAQVEAQNYAVNGSCTLGGQATVTQGMPSSGTRPLKGSTTFNGTGVMASYPGCTVTVFNTGTNTPAQIFSTANGGARSNPFTGDLTDGSWVFFAAAACYDITISSGATQASVMPNSKIFPGVCAGAGSGGGGGGGTVAGTQVTINGTAPVPNQLNFSNVLLPPANGTVINFQLNGTNAGAYLAGNGSATTCLLGTGWGNCPTGGGGGSATLPTTPIYDLFASTGAGAAQASGVLGSNGFVRAQVYTATGDIAGNQPSFQLFPNASVEYFPNGYANSQGTFGAAHGLALYMSHSGGASAAANGGVALGGGNSSGAGNLIYLDCEVAGCDFKVPVSYLGGGLGGGGSLPSVPQYTLFNSPSTGTAGDSGVFGQAGFLRAFVLEATGTSNPSPFSLPNGSIEYFANGATIGGAQVGGSNGVAIHFSHSSVSGSAGNGGIALAGGNSSGNWASYQTYLDCEQATGCTFKVPIYENSALVAARNPRRGVRAGAAINVFNSPVKTGFLESDVVTAIGDPGSGASPFTPPNASMEYFPTGGYGIGGANGVAIHFSHSGTSTNGGIALAGGNATNSANNKIYLDCESAPALGCDFKVPVTYNGNAIGGGSLSGTINSGQANFFAMYTGATTISSNTHLDDGQTQAGQITSTETLAAPGINVTGSGGISMTGAGGTLPTPVANQGGIGIGPGNVPEYYSNGGAWTAIGSGGGGGITGATANGGLTQTSTTLGLLTTCTNGQVLQWTASTSSWGCATAGGGIATIPNPILTTAGATLPAPTTGQGAIGIGPNGVPSISINGGGWLPIATSYSASAPIAHGAQATTCQAQSTGGTSLTISGLTINAGDTVLVGIGVYGGAAFTHSVTDSASNTYSNATSLIGSSATAAIFAATNVAQAASSVTVSPGTNTQKYSVCITTYTGVSALGVTTTTSGPSATTQGPVTLQAGAAGHFMLTAVGLGASTVTTFSAATAGTMLGSTSSTTGSAITFGLCENQALAAGPLTCTTHTANSLGWSAVAVELIGGGGGGAFSSQCPVTADIPFSTTAGTICNTSLPAQAKAWIVKCAIPWNFTTGQTGTANVTININQTQLSGTLPLTSPMVWTGVLWGTAGPVFGDVFQSNTGLVPVITTTGLSLSDGRVYTAFIDGVANVPAAGGNFSVQIVSSTGTGSIRSGAYCKIE